MSATDEEMHFAHDLEMDHVTYVLLVLSLAFAIYTFVLVLINTWATSGRNALASASLSSRELAPSANRRDSDGEEVELSKWYQRVPDAASGEADAEEVSSQFVIGEHDEERA